MVAFGGRHLDLTGHGSSITGMRRNERVAHGVGRMADFDCVVMTRSPQGWPRVDKGLAVKEVMIMKQSRHTRRAFNIAAVAGVAALGGRGGIPACRPNKSPSRSASRCR